MPELSLWGLVIGFALLAFGSVLKAVEFRHRANNSDKDIGELRIKLTTLQDENQKTVSSMAELHNKEVAELQAKITNLSNHKDSGPFEPPIYRD